MNFEEAFKKYPYLLMEGALAERLKREYHLSEHEDVAWAEMIYHEEGKQALIALWEQYRAIAKQYQIPFLATTPTRHANQERVKKCGLTNILHDNVKVLQELQESSDDLMFVGGLMGCKGDAYSKHEALNEEEAFTFHSWQANQFADAKVDFLYAGIMPCLCEAIGMAKAMAQTELPYIISFTIQKDGCLLDGTSIDEAIRIIDAQIHPKPLCYMNNCVHPSIVLEALNQPCNQSERVHKRFLGIQGNTSALPLDQLDGIHILQSADPKQLAKAMKELHLAHPMKIFGGCCGTNHHHLEEIAKQIFEF